MKTNHGLTLVEVLVTLAIIGMVAAIAIPPVVRFREEATEEVCRANLKTIDNAKLEWAVENNQSNDAEPTEEDLADYIRGEFPQPVVAGALYKIGNLITPALCSYHGNHSINRFGMTVPKAMVELVKEGKLTSTDVIGGDWYWDNDDFRKYELYPTSYYFEGENYSGIDARWPESGIDMGSTTPEININGKTLKGEVMVRHSKEFIEANKEYYQKCSEVDGIPPVVYYPSQMDEGGYEVFNSSDNGRTRTIHYYDHKGDLIGHYEQVRPPGGGPVDFYLYDSEGNIVRHIAL